MTPKSINCFISSANRNSTESVYDFTADFNDDLIKCNDDQYIRLNVISFDMLNTMYNFKNQMLEFPVYDLGISFGTGSLFRFIVKIPDGNYNVYSFIKWFENAYIDYYSEYPNWSTFYTFTQTNKMKISAFISSISYNPAQNSFTFKRSMSSDPVEDNNIQNFPTFFLPSWTIGIMPNKFLGIEQRINDISRDGTNTGYVNMVNYNKVIVRTKGISYDMNTIENIKTPTSKLTFSNILFWTSKQDVEPFRNITYSNVDGGNSFNVMLHDKRVNSINLQLTNEYGELITDAPNYLLVLQFTIYDKDDWYKDAILQISNNIKQIWVCILWIMENYLKII